MQKKKIAYSVCEKEKIRRMFNDIAGDYDKLNHIMSVGIDRIWREKAIRKVIDKVKPQEILNLRNIQNLAKI